MIHKYKMNGYNIVLDVCSGAIHSVDDITYDVLDYVDEDMSEQCPDIVFSSLQDKYSKTNILECYSELYALYKDDMLFCKDDYIDAQNLTLKHSPIKSLCLNIAHDCNLVCEYCFASTGDFKCGRTLMSEDTAKEAIDFLLARSVGRTNLEVDFFGGEPLMNFDVVRKTVEYGRAKEKELGKNIRFTITTNGVLLNDDIMDFINAEMSNVVLSIDGRPEVNDRVRRRIDGSGTYNSIVNKFKKLADSRGQDKYYVRGTFTAYNLDFANDVLHLADLGFKQVSIEPVVCDNDKSYAITEKMLPAIYNEYEKLSVELLKRNKTDKWVNFFHFMIDLEQGPCVIKRLRGCGCGNEYVAITPEGDIYPCHQFVGIDEYKMGNIHTGEFNKDIKEQFANCNIYSKPDCKDCFARFYCSGGCSAANYNNTGDIHHSYKMGCEIERKRVECAIMMKIDEMQNA